MPEENGWVYMPQLDIAEISVQKNKREVNGKVVLVLN
jgi:hypothetical protein